MSHFRPLKAVSVPLAMLLVLGASLGASAATPPSKAAPDQSYSAGHWRDGAQIYDKICGACHSVGVGPELRGRALPPEATAMIVRNGLGAMPAFRQTDFSDADLLAIGRWLEKSPAPPAPSGGRPTP